MGRIPIAVGGIADSPVVLGLTRSRLWIGLLGGLLVGIVAFNVLALSFNAASSKTAGISDTLKRENSALRAQLAGELSNEQLQLAASALGLIVPEPGAILYLEPRPGDAAAAAERITNGEITIGATVAAQPPVIPAEPVAPIEPVVAEPVDDPAASAPIEPAATAPESTSPPAAAATGGATVVP